MRKPRTFQVIQQIVLVMAVLGIAIWRGWGLWYRGILEHDEGHALLNANTYHHVLKWLLSGGPFNSGTSLTEVRDRLHQEGGTLYSAGKSGYSLLLAVCGVGGHVSQAEALFLAWVAGLMVCGCAAALAYVWFEKRISTAVIAGMGTGVSPLLGTLSREVSGTIWALALGMLGLVIMARSESSQGRHRFLLQTAGGAVIGYGFTCHFNLAPFVVAAFVAHSVFLHLKGLSPGAAARRIITPLMASAAVLSLFQGATWVADRRLSTVYPEFLTFAGELDRLLFGDQLVRLDVHQINEGVMGWGWDAWKYYGSTLLREGYLFSGLLALSLLYTVSRLRHRLRHYLPALALTIIPTAFWLAYPYKIERVLGMCIVPAWVLIAGVLSDHSHRVYQVPALKTRRAHAIIVIPILILLHAWNITALSWMSLWRQQSPMGEVAAKTLAYARTHQKLITAGSFDTGFAPLWKWTIVELQREEGWASSANADFSRFDGASIVFTDPATWRSSSGEFNVALEDIEAGFPIVAVKSKAPDWYLTSYDLSRSRRLAPP